ncbi:hypothetical protein SPFM8_00219 [Salmonella phage SPFM8]|nr:hypothetical protein SPFM8_00219 [Salmonella phage SPFM8]
MFQSAVDGQTMGILYPGMPVKYVFANEYGVYTKLEMSLGTIVQTTWNRSTHVVNAPIDPDKHFSDTDKPQRCMTTPDKFVAQADPAAYPGGGVGSVRVLDGRSSSFTPGDISDTSSLEYRDQAALNQGTGYPAHIDRTTDIAGNVIYLICGVKFNNTTKPKLVIYNLPREQEGIGVFQYLQRWYLYRPWDSYSEDFLSVFDYLQNHYGVYSMKGIEYDEEEQQAYRDIVIPGLQRGSVIPDSEDFLSVFDYLQNHYGEGQLKGIEYDEEEQQAYRDIDGLTVARSILADTLPEGVAAMDESMWFLRNRQVGGIYHETPTMFLSQSDEKSIALVTLELAGVFNYRGIVINNRDHNAESTSSAEGDLKVKLLLRRGQKIDICLLTHLTLAIPYSHMRMIGAPVTVLKMLSIIHTGHFTRHIANARGLPAIDYGIFLTVHL